MSWYLQNSRESPLLTPYKLEQVKNVPPKPRYNLLAYQNALLTQQKLLSSTENDNGEEESDSKSSIFVSQNIQKKPVKKPTISTEKQTNQLYAYYPQVPPTAHLLKNPTYKPEPTRYQLPQVARPVSHKPNFKETLEYPEAKGEYHTQQPIRQIQKPGRIPVKKIKYQSEVEDNSQPQYQQNDHPTHLYYQPEVVQFRRPAKPVKEQYIQPLEQTSEIKSHRLPYQPEGFLQYHSKYQPDVLGRRPLVHYRPEVQTQQTNLQNSGQNYPQESRLFPRYQQPSDLVQYQSGFDPSGYRGRGTSVPYRTQLQNPKFYRNLENPVSYVE